MKIPVIIGNCVTYSVTLELMQAGSAGVLIGVGPGAACTTRGVLGLGVPQVTATVDCAAARDYHFKQTGSYVPIITDGGMSKGGDICKAFACGSDAVMVGSAFARAKEAPGKGYHWGMATPHANLPRGTRIQVGVTGSLKQILFGPAELDDGSQNLVGALATCMGNVGAQLCASFRKPRSSSRPRSRPRARSSRRSRASAWASERADCHPGFRLAVHTGHRASHPRVQCVFPNPSV